MNSQRPPHTGPVGHLPQRDPSLPLAIHARQTQLQHTDALEYRLCCQLSCWLSCQLSKQPSAVPLCGVHLPAAKPHSWEHVETGATRRLLPAAFSLLLHCQVHHTHPSPHPHTSHQEGAAVSTTCRHAGSASQPGRALLCAATLQQTSNARRMGVPGTAQHTRDGCSSTQPDQRLEPQVKPHPTPQSSTCGQAPPAGHGSCAAEW